jgi:predicted RecA/RadA family phage recombinase
MSGLGSSAINPVDAKFCIINLRSISQAGRRGSSPVSRNVVSGQLIHIGNCVGVCAYDAASGQQCEVGVMGLFSLPKVSGDSYNQGDALDMNPATGLGRHDRKRGVQRVRHAASDRLGRDRRHRPGDSGCAAESITAREKLTPSVASPPTLLAAEHETHAHARPQERVSADCGENCGDPGQVSPCLDVSHRASRQGITGAVSAN